MRVTVNIWVCDECDYWRDKKSTGVHQTPNPENPNGRMVLHPLREVEFVFKAALQVEVGRREKAETALRRIYSLADEKDAWRSNQPVIRQMARAVLGETDSE